MKNNDVLKILPSGDKEIVITRSFNAPRTVVFDSLTKPDLIKRWLLGPTGWSMLVCEVDLKVGGAYRYVWRRSKETEMGMGGVFREIVRPDRLVLTEVFDESWYPGEALITTTLTEKGGKTTVTGTLLYDSREIREIVLNSNMKESVAAGYDKLAELLALIK